MARPRATHGVKTIAREEARDLIQAFKDAGRVAVVDKPISALQARLARHGLGLTVEQLAGRAGVSVAAVSNFEESRGAVSGMDRFRIKDALVANGAAFLNDDNFHGVAFRP